MSGKFALIIGNTEYIDPGLAQLTAPGRDAEDFARVLKDQEIGAFDQVNILLNQSSSTSIEAIDEFFDQKKPDDLLVLYFSGHGVRDELGALYLAVKNTFRTRLRSTAIKSDYIRDVMDQSRSKRQVLILDCCNSGAYGQGTKAATGVSIGTATAFEAGYGRIILTASDSTQFAWEGDKVIGETDNSLFTHYLVEGLEGEADLDGDGRITVDEVYDYAYEKVRLATPKQTPSKFSSKQQGEIVLRQNMRIEDIKPVSLPGELIEEIEDTRPYVREAAFQKLEKIVKGKNIGLARSARDALEKLAIDDNTTRRVAQMATQLLESIRQAERAEEERRAREEAERLATLKAEEERLAREKAEAEQRTKQEVERLLAEQKIKEERNAKKEAKRLAALKADEERLAREKAEVERKAKEEAERLLAEQKAEEERRARIEAEEKRLAGQKAEGDQLVEEKRLAEKKAEAERRAKELAAREATRLKTEREAAKKSVFSRMGKAWAGWSVSRKILVVSAILVTGFVLSCGGFFAYAMISATKEINLPLQPVQFVQPGTDPVPLPANTRAPSVYKVAFSPDGNLLASASDHGLQLWNVNDGSFIRTVDDFSIFRFVFSPDGQLLASSSSGGIKLWRVSNGTLVTTLTVLPEHAFDFAFSPDGQTIALGLADKTVRLLNVSDGALLQTLEGHTEDVESVAFSPDGQTLASGSSDNTIRLWRVSDGTLLQTLEGHTEDVESVAFSPDGQTLASGSSDTTIRLWNVSDGSLLQTLEGHTFWVFSVAFSFDGKMLASGSNDGTIRLWGITP